MPEDGKLDLIALRRLRGAIKSSLTTTQNWLNSTKEKSVTELKRRNDYISGKLNEFYDLQNKIYLLDENESDEYATTMEEMYFHITSRMDELIEEATCTTGNDNASISSESPSDSVKSSKNIRLSKLPLPEFDGKIEEWTSFYQRFTNAMNRKDLSDIDRIQYLVSCVKGDAALVIKNIAIIGENYTGALDLLQKRYDNKRINVRLFLQSLFNLPSVSVNSASSLREILNKVIVNVRALENLDYQRDKLSNELLVQLIVSKLDSKTREGWELQLSTLDSNVDDERDSYGELISFLEDRLQVLLSVYPTTSSTNAIKEGPKSRGQKTTLAVTSTPERSARMVRACLMCKKGHSLYACEDFRKLAVPQRYDKVKSLKLCVNCFGSKHWANQCTAGRCKECNGLHHTLLHRVEPETPAMSKQTTAPPAAGNASSPTVVSTVTQQSLRDVLLATAIVTVSSPSATCRAVAMLDGASHASFITNRLRYQLQAPVFNTATIISGFGGKTSKASTATKIQIASRNGECLIDVSALVSEKITDPLPTQSFDLTEAWNFIGDYDLADPEFNERKDIDILIGADVLYDILLPEFHKRDNAPTLQSSLLGWLVIGPYAALSFQPQVHCNLTTTQFNQISDFWELQDPPSISQRAECANRCDTHFRENYSRVDGRFQVRLPFRDDQRPATTRQQALARFKRMTFSEKYQEFMHQYESLGHMRLVPADESQLTESYYIPHHGIERDDKLRVVFDGSMKSSNGLSLNDCLQVGPTIQPTIFEVLLRFRTHQFVFTTDISKMYRQIMLHEADQRWQRIFWFHNDEVAEFQLTTVTYGTASAPYSAIRCLFQLAEDGRTTHPRAATILEKNCYVDDILAGSDTLDEAIELRNELCDLLGTARMELGKWRANTTALLPETVKNEDVPLVPSSIGKTLGVEWNSNDDTLRSPSYSNLPDAPITKRSALSMLARVFDPLGLLAPITVTGKLLIQELWTENVSWDDPVTPEFSKKFQKFLHSLQAASNMSFPRHIGCSNASSIELHAFADASARAYATCIYACIEHCNGSRTSTLLCAKTRVAPTRTKRTIPELELCAAALLVETLEPVATVLNIPVETCYAYSDSTVVLSYLARDPSHWRPFVANRVQKIIHKIPARKWRHIPGDCNPADIATRHRAASEFESRFELWSKGPEILCLNNDESTFHDWTPDESALTYLRSIKTTLATTVVHDINANWVETFFQRFSSYQRLVRTVAFILRVKYRAAGMAISASEYQAAERVVLRLAQLESFPAQAHDKQLSTLTPFTQDGLLRVGGRLEFADLSFNQRHPIIISSRHWISELLIRDLHRRYFHAGIRFITYMLKLRFWFVGSIQPRIKKCVNKCVRCIRHNRQPPPAPLMGTLPETRVRSTYPFDTVGIDFAGPLTTRLTARTKTTLKSYVAVFVCFASKAVHLEAVSALSTPAFLAALKRFAARRGYPSIIYSDNGTNFVGGASELEKQTNILLKEDAVQNFASLHQIDWRFNPPAAPHMGGLWESAVRITKYHLYRVTSTHVLNFEELSTFLCQIEAIMNSRPLTAIQSENTPLILTPGHFLIGRPLVCVPDATSDGAKLNYVQRWTLISQLRVNFWRAWKRDYLTTLQKRSKWSTKSQSLKVNDVVLLRDEDTPPLLWPLARISNIFPGKDNIVRVVDVVTSNGRTLRRPVVKLIPLFNINEEQ